MTILAHKEKHPDLPDFTPRLWGIGILVAAIIIVGIYFTGRFEDTDRVRDLQTWQEKLNLISQSRAIDVEHWVGDNFKELRALANNPSLQLYMTELKTARDSESPGEPSQKTYLRNLLLFTAQKAGFTGTNATAPIAANVEKGSKSGLVIMDNNNAIIASTLITPITREVMLEHAKQAAAGQESLIDIRKNKEGVAYIGFMVPIYAIQGDHNASGQIGRVIGIKVLDNSFFSLLQLPPGTTEKTMDAELVRKSGDKLEYLTPLPDGSKPLDKILPFNSNKLAEAELVEHGEFASTMKDYSGKVVLAASQPVTGTPWTLIVRISRAEAMAASNERRASLEAFIFMLTAFIIAVVVAVWRWASSRRATIMSGYFRRLAAKAQAQEHLLRLVADHQPEPVYIVDAGAAVQFANEKAASDAHMSQENMIGKTLRDIRGAALADQILAQCEGVLKSGQIAYNVERIPQPNKNEKVIRSAYVPLAHIPLVNLPEQTPGVLIVEQDLSEVVHEREERLNTQRQLIETLVTLVDKRDPFAANHSKLVSQIAYEVAVEMELDNITVETTRIAGTLMNIGKIVVPTELLTKTTALSAEEKRTINDSINAAAELLQGVSFDGPVAETLREWQEKWDGTGPLGLKGEAILISARIIAVANAFVGMVSPRSYRTAIPIESAIRFLLDEVDRHFDRGVVAALVNFVENHSGKAWLSKILEEQQRAA